MKGQRRGVPWWAVLLGMLVTALVVVALSPGGFRYVLGRLRWAVGGGRKGKVFRYYFDSLDSTATMLGNEALKGTNLTRVELRWDASEARD